MHDLWINRSGSYQYRKISRSDPSNQYKFACRFCGKYYGTDVVELVLHIGRVHDQARNMYTD